MFKWILTDLHESDSRMFIVLFWSYIRFEKISACASWKTDNQNKKCSPDAASDDNKFGDNKSTTYAY